MLMAVFKKVERYIKNKENRLYLFLYVSLFLYILVPWGYFDVSTYKTSFLPKQILLLFIGLFGGILALPNINKKFFGLLLFGCLIGGVAYFQTGFLEKHYILQLIYIKLAYIIYAAPNEVKSKVQKYLPYVLLVLLAKAFLFRHGNYIHGGYYSSNLFSTFILFALIPEFYYKRTLNIILAGSLLIFIGSKSVYISIFFALAFFSLKSFSWFRAVATFFFKNYLRLVATSIIIITTVTLTVSQLEHFKNWRSSIEPRRERITVRNMGRRGLIARDKKLIIADHDAKQAALLTEFPVSHTITSLYLRLSQYIALLKGLFQYYLFHGDVYQIATEAFGHNPHFSIFDLISRLGVLFLVVCFYSFRSFFRQINHTYVLIMLLPIICFQPFGYTLGHGILAFITFYSLIPRNEGTNIKLTFNPFGNIDKF